jgi:hypothetical protein
MAKCSKVKSSTHYGDSEDDLLGEELEDDLLSYDASANVCEKQERLLVNEMKKCESLTYELENLTLNHLE